MALSLANVVSPDLKLPYEVANLFSAGPTYAVLTAFAVLFLTLTVVWYRKVPAASSQTAEWFLTAGRNMKSGIIAASIVCTWTWAATLMVSSAKGYEHGIAGPYWYAAGATTPILLFTVLAVYLKRRAPMAHTFGEFVRHRFGGPSHRLLLCLGLMSCVIVTAMVVLGGAYALRTLIGLDIRVAVVVIPLAFAFYSALGGLRGSIVVEYVQMMVLLLIALVLTIWFWTSYGDLGVFERLRAQAPREGENYLTLASLSALLFGIVNTIGNLGTVFMDQTYWQRAIAASKESAGRSFLIGGLAWFAIPFGVATALGVGGLAFGLAVPVPYTDIAPSTAAAVFGPLGTWLFLIMLFMAIVSTGNAESVAVASLVATDIYKTYVRPQACDGDILRIARRTTLAFALLIGLVCLALHMLAIEMEWLYLTMGIFVGAGVIPLTLGLLTGRLTGRGAYWATLGGLVIGLMGWMTAANELEGAITLETLGRLGPVTIGNLSVILTSGLICALDCLHPHARFRFEQLRGAIRSYLETHESPSSESSSLGGEGEHEGETLTRRERRLIRWVVGAAILLELIIPGGLYLSGIQFGEDLFTVWVILSLVWLLLATGFIVLLPIKDHFETEYPGRLAPNLVKEEGGRTAVTVSIGSRLFLSFLTVVLTLGVGAVVSLVKLGSVEYLRGVNERVIFEEDLHEDMAFSLIPQVLEERSRGERDGQAASALSERVKLLAASPHTPAVLHTMISSPEPQDPIRYLSFGEKERVLLAGGIAAAYRGIRMANLSQVSQQRRQAIVLILISLVGTLTVGLILTIRTSAAITYPVRRLAEASCRFAAGDPPGPPVPVDTADEIGMLTEEFNTMAARIREQVTALKAVEEELRLIVSHVSDAIVYLDLAGIVRWANHQATLVTGRPMVELIGNSIMKILAREAAALAEARLAAVRRGESVPPLVEFEVLHPDGSVVFVEANITSVLDHEKVVGRLLVLRDITERKRAEEALRESKERFRLLMDYANDAIIYIDLRGVIQWASHRAAVLLGRPIRELLDRSFLTLLPPEAARLGEARLDAIRRGEPVPPLVEIEVLRPDATVVHAEANVTSVRAEGNLIGQLLVARDITERKKAEAALQQRLRMKKAVAQIGQYALAGMDLERLMNEAVTLVADTLGVEYSKVLELMPGDQALLLRAGVGWKEGLVGRATLGTGLDSQAGYTLVSGVPVIVEDLRKETRFSGPPLLYDHGVISGVSCIIAGEGRPFGVLGVHTVKRRTFHEGDVFFLQSVANVLAQAIERRRAEEALRASEERFRAFMNNSSVLAWIKDADGRYVYVNRPFELQHQRTFEEMEGKTDFDFRPEETAQQFRLNDQHVLSSGKTLETLETAALPGGGPYWLVYKFPMMNASRQRFVGGLAIDITQRKRAEEALRASEERFYLLMNHANDAILYIDLNGEIQWASHQVEVMTGLSRDTLIGRAIMELLTPEAAVVAATRLAAVRRDERVVPMVEIEFFHPGGPSVWGEANITSVQQGGETIGRLLVIRDITERKMAEGERERLFAQLRAEQERFQGLSRRLIAVQEAERRHLARELHDEVGQSLTGLKLGLEAAMHLPSSKAHAKLESLLIQVNDMVSRIRELALVLRPAMLDLLGLVPALAWHFTRYTEQTNVRVLFEHNGVEQRFDHDLETAVFRIIQEALTNVARHAGTANARVRLWANQDSLNVQIHDQGCGFDPAAALATGSAGGLSGMQERATLLGGCCQVESASGAGTLVTAEFLLPTETEQERKRNGVSDRQ